MPATKNGTSERYVDAVLDRVHPDWRAQRPVTRRGEVLLALRRLGYQVTCGDLAEIMGRPSYSVGNALTALYSRDLIDRTPVVGANQKFVYRAKVVSA
jgi:hypothetical protein